MGEFMDTALVIIILLFLVLIVWSKIMGQRMLDTFKEIKSMVAEAKQTEQ